MERKKIERVTEAGSKKLMPRGEREGKLEARDRKMKITRRKVVEVNVKIAISVEIVQE